MDLLQASDLARGCMIVNGLKSWKFEFDDNAVARFGRCSYHTKTISLSKILVQRHSENKVYEIILHEVAHALTPGHKHDEVWRAKCIQLGGNGERCWDTHGQEHNQTWAWVGTCPACGRQVKRHRDPGKRRTCSCYYCSKKYNNGRYDRRFQLIWVEGGFQPMTLHDIDMAILALNVQEVNK